VEDVTPAVQIQAHRQPQKQDRKAEHAILGLEQVLLLLLLETQMVLIHAMLLMELVDLLELAAPSHLVEVAQVVEHGTM
jgi:hypothetical protein